MDALIPTMVSFRDAFFSPFMDAFIKLGSNYWYLAEASHVFKIPAFDALAIDPLVKALGMEAALIKYTVGLFLVYPFAAILRAIPSTNFKHLFSMLGGIFLVQWVFGEDWIHSLLSSAVTYLICLVFPAKSQAKMVFLWVMGYMTMSHVYRMYVSYLSGVFDFTGTQMVLTMKLTSFAYNLFDGTADWKRVSDPNPSDPKKRAVYAEGERFAIRKLPNPLEFFGYIFCFTCILAGPAFEYNDYISSVNGSAFEKKQNADDKMHGTDSNSKKAAPSSLFPSLKSLFIGVVCLVGHLVTAAKYPLSRVYDTSFIASHSHLERYIYTWVALFAERLKYYFAWKVAEGASQMGGFGFRGFDKDGKASDWSAVENISIVGFETATNVQGLSRSWNKRTQGWLERYTYLRSGKSLVMTYFISALWHGLYPGFFLFFMSVPILTEIERLVRAKINPILVPSFDGRKPETYPKSAIGSIYQFVCWAMVTVVMNYIVQVFPIQSWGRCMAAWGSYNHAAHIFLFVSYFVLRMIPSAADKKKKAA